MSRYLLTNDKMFDTKHNTLVYEEFLKFKEIFFEKGVSFFDPTIKLFDDDKVFYEFENRIIQNYDDSKLKSLNKYLNQLKGSSKKFRHFFACIIWLYNYPIHDKKILLNPLKYKNISVNIVKKVYKIQRSFIVVLLTMVFSHSIFIMILILYIFSQNNMFKQKIIHMTLLQVSIYIA